MNTDQSTEQRPFQHCTGERSGNQSIHQFTSGQSLSGLDPDEPGI